jgi:RND family efflux transporter MFP subunit
MMARQTPAASEKRTKPGRRPVVLFFAVLAIVVAAAIAAGLMPRLARQKGLLAAAQEVADRKPVVIATAARLASSKDAIDLPGDLVAMIETPILARADGYLKSRLVDLGYRVAAGQPMAEIETPELDQQISQARASLSQAQAGIKELQADISLAQANLDLARVTWTRWQKLVDQGVISKQDADARRADLAVKEAQAQKAEAALATAQENIHVVQANLRRLEELKSFARVTAPFDGVVTARNVDIGTLITAGSKEMFRVAQIQPMRIFVNVPQTNVASIHQGDSAELRVQEKPGQVFPAKVTGISTALDATSRAMLVILQTPNTGAVLYPGMYAQVRFAPAQGRPALRIPGDTLIMSKDGPRVAVVGTDHLIHFRSIAVAQDLGSEVEVSSGLSAGDMVVSNPSDAVRENAAVEVRSR